MDVKRRCSMGDEIKDKGTNESTEVKEGTETTPKTFTQEELDSIVNEKVATLKKDQPRKEELEAFNAWKESQKTEKEKTDEALTNAEKARLVAEERANGLEAKVACLSKGVIADAVDDVVILAKAMVTEEMTIDQAIDKVLEKYPNFKNEHNEEQKGFKIGAHDVKQKGNPNDLLSKAFGNK